MEHGDEDSLYAQSGLLLGHSCILCLCPILRSDGCHTAHNGGTLSISAHLEASLVNTHVSSFTHIGFHHFEQQVL